MGYIIKLSSYCKSEVLSWRHNNHCKFYTKKSLKTSILTTRWYSVSNFSSRHTFRPERCSWGIHQNEGTPRGNLLKPPAINMKSAHYSIRPATAGDVDFYWQMADVSDHSTASMQQYIAGTKGSTGDMKTTKRLQGQYWYLWGGISQSICDTWRHHSSVPALPLFASALMLCPAAT